LLWNGTSLTLTRDYAAAQGVSEKEALEKGMEVKSIEFVK